MVRKHPVPRKRKASGLAPGTLVHVGTRHADTTSIVVKSYDENNIDVQEVKTAEEAKKLLSPMKVTWINVIGLHDTALIESFGKSFDLHPLLLEDIVNTEQRPKLEQYENATFIVLKAIHAKGSNLEPEHLSIVLTKQFLITFQEKEGDVYGAVLERLKAGRKIRALGEDYLCYALMDSVVDHYYTTFEDISEHIDELEEEALNDPDTRTMQKILELKREMIIMQKATWPVREIISGLLRGDSPYFKKSTHVYLRDVYDHSIQVMESVQSLRDVVGGIMDLYMSSVSNKMNEVMKVLTIIATIFIPLTFVAGVYGMNFQYMPELQWRHGYLAVWILMGFMALGLTWFFKKRSWL